MTGTVRLRRTQIEEAARRVQERSRGSSNGEKRDRMPIPRKAKAALESCEARADGEERRSVHSILNRLGSRKDYPDAKKLLALNLTKRISDANVEAMVYLEMHGNMDARKALERSIDRLEKDGRLDALAYVAGMSDCTPEAKLRAAEIIVQRERRAGNLQFVRDTCENDQIRNMMMAALSRFGEAEYPE